MECKGDELARMVVEDHLKIQDFIEEHKVQISRKLEQYDENLKDKAGGDLLFIAESLPLINGIVQVGSSHENFQHAIKWIRDEISQTGAVPILTALTFMYVVERQMNDPSMQDDRQRAAWSRICQRVRKLYEGGQAQ